MNTVNSSSSESNSTNKDLTKLINIYGLALEKNATKADYSQAIQAEQRIVEMVEKMLRRYEIRYGGL